MHTFREHPNNYLALQPIAIDFSDRHTQSNSDPTTISRAPAIVHLAAHDAYVQITKLMLNDRANTFVEGLFNLAKSIDTC